MQNVKWSNYKCDLRVMAPLHAESRITTGTKPKVFTTNQLNSTLDSLHVVSIILSTLQ